MHPTEALTRLGGVSDRKTLLGLTGARRLRTAVAQGLVLKVGHGGYALPTAHVALRAAARLSGTASHASAAAIHGWELGRQPERPMVVVPRNRKVERSRRDGVDLRWRDLEPHEVHGRVTAPHRTVIDCAKDLPFCEALAIADSALRHRDVDHEQLVKLALALPSTGRKAALRVVEAASPLAANPFESMLRAIALDVPGLRVEPQVWIDERGFRGRPDLVDRERRIVIEAESFEFHGRRRALKKDCERYTALVIRGWTVVRRLGARDVRARLRAGRAPGPGRGARWTCSPHPEPAVDRLSRPGCTFEWSARAGRLTRPPPDLNRLPHA